ncbi:alpha/beta hydrolase [Nocardia cyriacigeorgica]|uniref:Alpha/beta hydrolase n=1 Tax=Nocardia cyriacigeorgica TaxID=135487 RepID=A0A5R8P5P3_9NOCA|nr:alpha/beta hydrolase [Nocardia cyriacigeorgica]TLF94960.1 alpha/beta hydrolase [Nocardia cyriacigeorgica]
MLTKQPTQTQVSSVTIEYPRRASLVLRIAHRLSYAILRQGMNAIIALVDRGIPFTDARNFHISALLDLLAAPLVPIRGTRRRMVKFDKFRAEWVWHDGTADPDKRRDAAILYMHGGGLVSCGLNSHRRLVSRIAKASGVPVLNVDYRQLPKAHVTETLEDCVEAYGYLLQQGFSADHIILAGDSAGGGLSFRLAVEIRDRGLPMPAAIAAIAPWADYDSTRRSAHPNDRIYPMLSAAALGTPGRLGLARDGKLDPKWSAVNHDFTGLPPVLIQVGSTEVLRSDADHLAANCAAAGVPCRMQIWHRAIHVFQAGADLLPDARQAIGDIGAFTKSILSGTDVAATSRRGTAA